MNKILIFVILSFSLIACSKKKEDVEPIYTEEEFVKVTSSLSAVAPNAENSIPFHEYSKPANHVTSKIFSHERLKFYAVDFETTEAAKSEAKRLNQYYSKNFLLDQVEGEPILEDLVINIFKAKNPNRSVQKIPKAAAHGSEHGSGHGNEHGAPAHH